MTPFHPWWVARDVAHSGNRACRKAVSEDRAPDAVPFLLVKIGESLHGLCKSVEHFIREPERSNRGRNRRHNRGWLYTGVYEVPEFLEYRIQEGTADQAGRNFESPVAKLGLQQMDKKSVI